MSKESMFSLRDIYPNYLAAQSLDDKAALEPADQKELNPEAVKSVNKSVTPSNLVMWLVVFVTLIALYHVKGVTG